MTAMLDSHKLKNTEEFCFLGKNGVYERTIKRLADYLTSI